MSGIKRGDPIEICPNGVRCQRLESTYEARNMCQSQHIYAIATADHESLDDDKVHVDTGILKCPARELGTVVATSWSGWLPDHLEEVALQYDDDAQNYPEFY